MFFLGQGIVIT